MSPHDDPERLHPQVVFSRLHDGQVLVARRAVQRRFDTPGMDFYLIVQIDHAARKVLARSVDGIERWTPAWVYDTVITQTEAEALGAVWRVAPQERPGLVGPPVHPHRK